MLKVKRFKILVDRDNTIGYERLNDVDIDDKDDDGGIPIKSMTARGVLLVV